MNLRPRLFSVSLCLIVTGFFFGTLNAQTFDKSVTISTDTLSVVQEDRKLLTGYTEQQLSGFTGSVSFAEESSLQIIPTGDVISRLQGLVPGLRIIGTGEPGIIPQIFTRGVGRFSGNISFIIVDGIPVSDISYLNPDDVETVAVLKDAGAAAIYGIRAMNGVLVIRTRQGKKGFHVNYSMQGGWQFPGKGTADKVLDTREHAELQWLVYRNENYSEIHPLYGPGPDAAPVMPPWAANTDWYDALADRAGIMNHNLSISGGNKNSKFYLGAGYFNQDGILLNTGIRRLTTTLNGEIKLLRRFTIGENFTISGKNGRYADINDNLILTGPYRSLSIIPVRISTPVSGPTRNFSAGEYGGTGMAPRLGNAPNVVALQERNSEDFNKGIGIIGKVYAEIKVLEGLSLRSSYGGTLNKGEIFDLRLAAYENAENAMFSIANESESELNSRIWTTMLNYGAEFGAHEISAVGGYEKIRSGPGNYPTTTRLGNFSSFAEYEERKSSLTTVDSETKLPPLELQSIFIRAEYSLMKKYMAGLTLRSDHASENNLNKDEKELFPAVSAGWRISSEPFLADVSWIDELKIRGSWGKTGYLSMLPAYATISNIGLDSRFLDDHLMLSLDVYRKDTNLPASAPDGSTSDIRNSGMDVDLSYADDFGNTAINVDAIFTTCYNKIISLPAGYFDTGEFRIGNIVRNRAGYPVSSFYGYQVAGLFSGTEEISRSAVQQGAQPGFFRYADVNNDNVIDPGDRTFLGNPHPDFTLGLNIQVTHKNFDLSALFYWSQGNEIFNTIKWWTDFWPSFQGQKSKDLLYNSWTESNKQATVPKASNTSNFSTNTQITSYYVEDGSYLRMKSLQLGYTFRRQFFQKRDEASLRIYLQAVNLFTFTGYSGLDPELSGRDNSFGIDYGTYPCAKQLIFGLVLGI